MGQRLEGPPAVLSAASARCPDLAVIVIFIGGPVANGPVLGADRRRLRWSGFLHWFVSIGLQATPWANDVRRSSSGVAAAGAKWFGWLRPACCCRPPFRRPEDEKVLILIYVMLGWGLNIVVGLAGLLDLGYVAFYAVGAYAYALLDAVRLGLLEVPAARRRRWPRLRHPARFPDLRLRGDYLAIVTLGFGEIIRVIL
jgi:branched-chain amino acid transport system permease protein